MNKRRWRNLFLGVTLLTLIALCGVTIGFAIRQPKLPNELYAPLEDELVKHLSSLHMPPTVPSLYDQIFGYESYRYRVATVDSLNENGLCIKVSVGYRELFSKVFKVSSTEEFLFLARLQNGRWFVEFIRQSGLDLVLSDTSCIETTSIN